MSGRRSQSRVTWVWDAPGYALLTRPSKARVGGEVVQAYRVEYRLESGHRCALWVLLGERATADGARALCLEDRDARRLDTRRRAPHGG